MKNPVSDKKHIGSFRGASWADTSPSEKVVRGGRWNRVQGALRSAKRYYRPASTRPYGFGFRVVRTKKK